MLYVRVDDSELRALLRHMPDQVKFALSLSLNHTAWDARQTLARELPEHFVIRNKWTERGMRVAKSTKNHLLAAVGSTREYMVAQTFAETRTSGGMAVPLVGRGRPRPRITSRTPPRRWPRRLALRRNVFIGRAGLGRKVHGVWRRTPKPTRSKTAKRGLRLLYRLPEEIRVPARWPLKETVEEVVSQRWPRHVVDAVAKAIATARKRK